MFSTLPNQNLNFWVTFILLSAANAFNLEESKIVFFGKELLTEMFYLPPEHGPF